MDFKIIRRFDSSFAANIALSRLQQDGIHAQLLDENTAGTAPFLTNIIGGIKLVAPHSEEKKALELLEAYDQQAAEVIRCPKCGNAMTIEEREEKNTEKSSSILGRLADNIHVTYYKCGNCGFETRDLPVPESIAEAQKVKVIAVIPARYASTRFPFKLMQNLGGKAVIRHTYDNAIATKLFDDVLVVTDSDVIFNEVNSNGGRAIMSKNEHESGSDRIAEAVQDIDAEVIVNVQGDEPFVHKESLEKLVRMFDDDAVQVASLMKPIADAEDAANPNIVKVVTDIKGDALYFSRSMIPYYRDEQTNRSWMEHIGVYAFRKAALLQFTQWPLSSLEQKEKLEQLRYLENGVKIRMVETPESSVKIDVPEDLQKAEAWLASKGNDVAGFY